MVKVWKVKNTTWNKADQTPFTETTQKQILKRALCGDTLNIVPVVTVVVVVAVTVAWLMTKIIGACGVQPRSSECTSET